MNNLIQKFQNGKNISYRKLPNLSSFFTTYYQGSDGNLYTQSRFGFGKMNKVAQTTVPDYKEIRGAYRKNGKWYRTSDNSQIDVNKMENKYYKSYKPKVLNTSQEVVIKPINNNNYKPNSTNNTINKPLYTRAYRQRVADLGLKDVDAVKAIQRQLGVNDDGIWGDITEKAYMSKVQGDRFSNPDVLKPISKPSYNIPTVETVDERGNITLNNPNIIPKYNNFLNLNTLPKFQDSINKPLSQLTFAKKGSKLISRNPIERFRNK